MLGKCLIIHTVCQELIDKIEDKNKKMCVGFKSKINLTNKYYIIL